MNWLRSFLLLTALTLLFVLIGQQLGGNQGMVFALIFAGFTNFIAWWFSDKIILLMTGAKAVPEHELPEVRRILSELSTKNNMPLPKLYFMDTPMPNAFATGRNPQNAAVAVTRGIIDLLSAEELKGVIAHELGHIRNRDTLISTIAATIAGAIFMLARMAQWAAIFGGMGGRDRNRGGSSGIGMLLIAIIAPVAALIIQMALSRSREYQADKTGAELSGTPLSLASALRKISAGVTRTQTTVNPVTNHLFIVSPLKGSDMLTLFSTHPPVNERVKRLESIAEKMAQNKYDMPKIIY